MFPPQKWVTVVIIAPGNKVKWLAKKINKQTKNKTQKTHPILKVYNKKTSYFFSFELDITK